MLHWHPSHKSSKPKLNNTIEKTMFYSLLFLLILYIGSQVV